MTNVYDAPPPPDPRDQHEARVAYWLIGVACLFVVGALAAWWYWP